MTLLILPEKLPLEVATYPLHLDHGGKAMKFQIICLCLLLLLLPTVAADVQLGVEQSITIHKGIPYSMEFKQTLYGDPLIVIANISGEGNLIAVHFEDENETVPLQPTFDNYEFVGHKTARGHLHDRISYHEINQNVLSVYERKTDTARMYLATLPIQEVEKIINSKGRFIFSLDGFTHEPFEVISEPINITTEKEISKDDWNRTLVVFYVTDWVNLTFIPEMITYAVPANDQVISSSISPVSVPTTYLVVIALSSRKPKKGK